MVNVNYLSYQKECNYILFLYINITPISCDWDIKEFFLLNRSCFMYLRISFHRTYLNQIYQMFVSQPLEHANLSQGNLLNPGVILCLKKFLDCHNLNKQKSMIFIRICPELYQLRYWYDLLMHSLWPLNWNEMHRQFHKLINKLGIELNLSHIFKVDIWLWLIVSTNITYYRNIFWEKKTVIMTKCFFPYCT